MADRKPARMAKTRALEAIVSEFLINFRESSRQSIDVKCNFCLPIAHIVNEIKETHENN